MSDGIRDFGGDRNIIECGGFGGKRNFTGRGGYGAEEAVDKDFGYKDNKKPLGNNPKDLLGIKRVSITKLPAAGVIHGAHAMMDGASKYGPYNWRENAVIASIYIDAAMRHLQAWFDEKEEVADDSGVHHLGHVIACASILLDAQETGNLIDDRPKDGKAAQILKKLNEKIKVKAEAGK